MRLEYNDETVVYIEYHGKIPHSAITVGDTGYMSHWDFEYFHGDKKNIRFYQSGGGGHMSKISAPTYCDGCTMTSYWIADCASLEGVPANITKIEKPIRVNGYMGTSINPFHSRVGEETNNIEYCEVCDERSSEYCMEHIFEDNEGNLRYIKDNSIAE